MLMFINKYQNNDLSLDFCLHSLYIYMYVYTITYYYNEKFTIMKNDILLVIKRISRYFPVGTGQGG